MNRQKDRFAWFNHPVFFTGMVVLGLMVGWLLPASTVWLNPLLKTYVSLLNLFVFPLILLSIIFGLAQFSTLPKSPQRLVFAALFGFIGLLISGLIAILICYIFMPGQGISDELRLILGNLSLDKDPVLSISFDAKLLDVSLWTPGMFVPSNLLFSFAYQTLAFAMVGSLIFGMGFSLLPTIQIKSIFENLEVIYIALENLILIVNRCLPFVAFVFAANIMSSIEQGWLGLVASFLVPFLVAVIIAGFVNFSIIAWVAEVKLSTVFTSLGRALTISFLARNPAAGVPDVIFCLCDRFGFKRSMVRFFAPLFPIFFNAGEVIFFTMLSLFVANVYDQNLSFFSMIYILALAVISSFVSASIVGAGSLVMATFMLKVFYLPFDALLPAFFVLEIFLAGAKSALSLLFASAVIAMVSRGLARESVALNEVDESFGSTLLNFSIDKKILLWVYAMFMIFLITVFAIGVGVGGRSIKFDRNASLTNPKNVVNSSQSALFSTTYVDVLVSSHV
jgi:Na+/H+-dicarboxylate symporter